MRLSMETMLAIVLNLCLWINKAVCECARGERVWMAFEWIEVCVSIKCASDKIRFSFGSTFSKFFFISFFFFHLSTISICVGSCLVRQLGQKCAWSTTIKMGVGRRQRCTMLTTDYNADCHPSTQIQFYHSPIFPFRSISTSQSFGLCTQKNFIIILSLLFLLHKFWW